MALTGLLAIGAFDITGGHWWRQMENLESFCNRLRKLHFFSLRLGPGLLLFWLFALALAPLTASSTMLTHPAQRLFANALRPCCPLFLFKVELVLLLQRTSHLPIVLKQMTYLVQHTITYPPAPFAIKRIRVPVTIPQRKNGLKRLARGSKLLRTGGPPAHKPAIIHIAKDNCCHRECHPFF